VQHFPPPPRHLVRREHHRSTALVPLVYKVEQNVRCAPTAPRSTSPPSRSSL
jgi:hypothetical protein